MKKQKIFAVLLIFALLNSFTVQAQYYWELEGPGYFPSYEEWLEEKIDKGVSETILKKEYQEFIKVHKAIYPEDWKQKGWLPMKNVYAFFTDTSDYKEHQWGVLNHKEEVVIPFGKKMKVYDNSNYEILVLSAKEQVDWYGSTYSSQPEEKQKELKLEITLFDRFKPEDSITFAMAIFATHNENEKWKKHFESIQLFYQTGHTWEEVEQIDVLIEKLFDVNQQSYFGVCDWLNLFPDKEIIFSDINIQSFAQLDEPSAIKGKTMAQALQDNDYLILLIPEKINNQPITSNALAELFPQGKKPGFIHYGNDAWQNSLLQQVTFNASSSPISGLHIVKKTPFVGSYDKSWNQQLKLKPQNHSIPNVATVEILHFVSFLKKKDYLCKNISYRTCDTGISGDHVYVTATDQGLDIWDFNDEASPDIGLALELRT